MQLLTLNDTGEQPISDYTNMENHVLETPEAESTHTFQPFMFRKDIAFRATFSPSFVLAS